ncbi:MAG: alcohol dehydrogenase [Actinobacteria bacterium 13_2_20CM_2_66_6]|nr:MAG: alcohol dehydrogenase [Actinobacteria bacterium 13_2_20CM_2_66_6]TME93754.1 MAG: zinc-binding dehydrogenase [Chloroflexota bacterium]
MKALTFRAEGEVKMADVPKPRIAASTDALIRITLGAVCGSDLHILHGHTPMNEGAVLGHEFVGLVEEVGPEVKRFKPGDRVVSSFFTSCGHCVMCRKGWFNQCVSKATFGHGEYFGGLGGGQAEYVVVPLADHSMEIIPEGMTDEQAIFVGDILSTGFFGAERAEIKPGDTVAVVGAGPVGLMATMCAQLFGPARTFVIDMVESRLEVAQELGGIPINAKEVHPVAAIEKATGGIGADSSIEAVGLLSAVDTAINCVRGGGTISMVGVPSAVLGDFPYLRMWMKSLTFRAGWCNVQLYMRPLLDLIAAGRLRPELIISHRMKLDQAEEAYRIFDAREATKIVLTP